MKPHGLTWQFVGLAAMWTSSLFLNHDFRIWLAGFIVWMIGAAFTAAEIRAQLRKFKKLKSKQ